jgi:hypothetical protein
MCILPPPPLGKITKDGVFLEQLETDPARFLPEVTEKNLSSDVVQVRRDISVCVCVYRYICMCMCVCVEGGGRLSSSEKK